MTIMVETGLSRRQAVAEADIRSSRPTQRYACRISLPFACVEVVKTDEKGADVNVATALLDVFQEKCASALVVINDAELAEPIQAVRR
ncbi:hypothetical protein [Microbispora triticiradicis]|uniref:hypothetical protein n=1 Tax=Microbispora triticiradicis TaxID=2200763 RepID=UPI001AD62E1B|nr:hypothetical protein [Microbispora triticiradicis]MBO4271976.1 hypothetical protein [Microbispora triticiradicis]